MTAAGWSLHARRRCVWGLSGIGADVAAVRLWVWSDHTDTGPSCPGFGSTPIIYALLGQPSVIALFVHSRAWVRMSRQMPTKCMSEPETRAINVSVHHRRWWLRWRCALGRRTHALPFQTPDHSLATLVRAEAGRGFVTAVVLVLYQDGCIQDRFLAGVVLDAAWF